MRVNGKGDECAPGRVGSVRNNPSDILGELGRGRAAHGNNHRRRKRNPKENLIDLPAEMAAAVTAIVDGAERYGFSRPKRLRTARFIHRRLVPPKGPSGRPRQRRLDAALVDYENGVRGVALYKKHIPNWDRLSKWQRRIAQERLSNALTKRRTRRRKALARRKAARVKRTFNVAE